MENATKALLIAAAVLIAILLISLGVGVFNTASEQMSNADLTEYETQKFNEKFAQYNGKNKTGSEVNALLDTVFTHNNSQADNTTCVRVCGKATVTSSVGLTVAPVKVSTGARYEVVCHYNSKTGLIEKIEIK